MTIRGKVTLWYSVVLLLSFLLAGGGMYFELIYERGVHFRKHKPQEPLGEEVGEVLGFYIFPALALTVLGGWFLLRRSFAPLDQLTRAAEQLNAKNLRDALPRTFNGDEVDRLSEVLNAMNQRLSGAMDEIQEFTLHASHELKTPLTILHSEIETALGVWNLTAEQRQSLGSQLDEIQRLTRIVESLSLLARLNSGQIPCARDLVQFHAILQDIAEDAAILARPRRIQLDVKICEPMIITGDQHRLRQLFLNLADNAVKYNREDGAISITTRINNGTVEVEIGNTGPGIAPKDLPNICDKFFRGSSRRTEREDPDGLGLGLSIAQSIVKAHRGSLKIETAKPGWTFVRVVLPRT